MKPLTYLLGGLAALAAMTFATLSAMAKIEERPIEYTQGDVTPRRLACF